MVIKDTTLFDDLSIDEQRQLVSDVHLSDEANSLVEMHDNETLHKVAKIIHKAWGQKNGIDADPADYDAIDTMHDLMLAWDRCLIVTHAGHANNELSDREENIGELKLPLEIQEDM